MLRRFSRRVQLSGRLLEARKLRFHTRDKNKNSTRESALRRLQIAAKREYLIKVGKLVEDDRRRNRGRR